MRVEVKGDAGTTSAAEQAAQFLGGKGARVKLGGLRMLE
jgi:hypothetical protein